MKYLSLLFCLVAFSLYAQGSFNKVGTTSFQFLKVIPDARSNALGEAYVSVGGAAEVAFWNPASLTGVEGISATLSHLDWLLDVTQSALAVSYELNGIGVIGFQAMINNVGDIVITDPRAAGRDPQTGEYNPGLTNETFSPSSQVFGLTFARSVTDKFSFGLTAKYAKEDLFVANAAAVIFDAGLLYSTGINSLQLGASLRNFGGEIKFADKSFPLPQVLAIGVSGFVYGGEDSFFKGSGSHRILVSFDLAQTRDHSQQQQIGLEYNWQEMIFLRAGYKFNFDIEDLTLGAGLRYHDYSIDYSYHDMGTYFDAVHRFTISFNWK